MSISKIVTLIIISLFLFIGVVLGSFSKDVKEKAAISDNLDLRETRTPQKGQASSGEHVPGKPSAKTFNVQDYASIQDAINSMPTGGGILYIPAGTYFVERTIELVSGLTIIGDGDTTKIVAAGNLHAHIFSPKTTLISNVTIKNLQIDGNKTDQDSGSDGIIGISDGIYLNGHDFVIEKVEIHDTYGEGIALHNAKNVRIAYCTIYDSRDLNAGIASSGDCTGIDIIDSALVNNGKNIVVTNGSGITINGVVNSGAKYDGIEIAGGNSDIEITGGMHNMNMYTGINIAKDVKNCRISKATIHSNGRAGISLFGADLVTISNCVLFNNSSVDEGRSAISLRGDESKGCSNIRINNNKAFDGRSDKTQAYGVDNRWDPEGDYITILNNDFTGNLGGETNIIYGAHNKTDEGK